MHCISVISSVTLHLNWPVLHQQIHSIRNTVTRPTRQDSSYTEGRVRPAEKINRRVANGSNTRYHFPDGTKTVQIEIVWIQFLWSYIFVCRPISLTQKYAGSILHLQYFNRQWWFVDCCLTHAETIQCTNTRDSNNFSKPVWDLNSRLGILYHSWSRIVETGANNMLIDGCNLKLCVATRSDINGAI